MEIDQFKLERFFAEHEFSAPHLLCCSDCESRRVAEILTLEDGAEQRLRDLWLGYTESQGAPGLRREIANLYESIGPEQILVHSGAEEAIFNFMSAMLSPGDHVIVHYPGYQSLFEVAQAMGCGVDFWRAREEDNWALDLDQLRSLLRSETKAVVLNTPHNPTGYLMDHGMFAELFRLSEEHGFRVFCDEVYRGLEHDPALRLNAACEQNPRAVSLGVMSKTYGLAGLRIGWIATRDGEVYRRMSAFKDYTTICNSAPSELLAEIALRHQAQLVKRNMRIILDNLKLLKVFFSQYAEIFNWRPPLAGPIAFPSLRVQDADVFCADLRKKTGVLLLPGGLYGPEFQSNFRLGFGRADLREGLEKMDAYLRSR